MTDEKLIELIRKATVDVFEMMLGLEVAGGEAQTTSEEAGPTEGVLALVGLAGKWAGSGTFSCSAQTARNIAGQMLMQEFGAVDDDVLDAIGEVANMILGNVKTSLEEELGPMGLSIPTVVYGRNFTTRSVGRSEWIVVPFQCLGDRVEVHLCLIPSKESGVPHRSAAALVHGG